MKLATRRSTLAIFLGASLLLILPSAKAQSSTSATDQKQTPGAAYQDGFNHGKADAAKSLPSHGEPDDQWTADDAQSAYRLGYGAGYAQGSSESGYFGAGLNAVPTAGSQPSKGDAASIAYEDGRAAGRRDLDAGNAFRPSDGEMYKNADHGWTREAGNKDQYRQAYREAYVRGYQEGYGNSPTTY